MKILDVFTLALAGVVAAGIAGQNIGYLPSTKEPKAPAQRVKHLSNSLWIILMIGHGWCQAGSQCR